MYAYQKNVNSDYSNDDFNVVQYGKRECRPEFCVYYKTAQNYLLHYVYSGKGTFNVNKKQYNISAHQAFIIYPGQEAWYTSDAAEPFTYRWVEFFGNKAIDFLRRANLTMDTPVYNDTEPFEAAAIMAQMADSDILTPLRLTGHFWMLVDSMAKNQSSAPDNVLNLFNAAVKYIQDNSDKPLTVEDVANAVCVSRGYLSRIFSKYIKQSPKEYIANYHINEAKSLLSGTAMSISEIAAAVGYQNMASFFKTFKKIADCTPSQFRASASRDFNK